MSIADRDNHKKTLENKKPDEGDACFYEEASEAVASWYKTKPANRDKKFRNSVAQALEAVGLMVDTNGDKEFSSEEITNAADMFTLYSVKHPARSTCV